MVFLEAPGGRGGRQGKVLDAVGRVLLLMLEIGSEDSIC